VRYLILSDSHANREALEATLARAQGLWDEVLCLGDVVGYGADPNFCVEWTQENAKRCVRGNHDKACAGLDDLEWFNAAAKASAVWTQSVLSEPNIQWLRGLAKGPLIIENFQILHGSPLDEDEYLLQMHEARQLLGYLEVPLSFFGHTHVQGGFQLHRNGVIRIPPVPRDVERSECHLENDSFYLINPGSVGQPRDGDPRAAFATYDTQERLVTYYRVAYDITAAQKRIRSAGLPELLARRLGLGQ